MRRRSRWVKALVSVAFFVVLFSVVRKGDFAALMRRVNPLYLVLSLLIIPAQIGVSCLKWKVLIDQPGRKLPFGCLLKIYLIGYYFSNLLPSNVGGDVVRSYYAGRRIGSQTHAGISVFVERFTGSLYMLFLVLVCPLLMPGSYRSLAFIVPSVLAALVLAGFAWLTRLKQPAPAILGGVTRAARFFGRRRGAGGSSSPGPETPSRIEAVCRRALDKAEEIHEKLLATARSMRADRRKLAAVVLLTVVFYALTWVNVYWAFRTFGTAPAFRHVAAVLPTAMLAGMIPITLGSLGIAEGAYVFFFGLAGVDAAATLAMGLFLRLKLLAVGAAGFGSYLSYRHQEAPGVPGSPGGEDGPASGAGMAHTSSGS